MQFSDNASAGNFGEISFSLSRFFLPVWKRRQTWQRTYFSWKCVVRPSRNRLQSKEIQMYTVPKRNSNQPLIFSSLRTIYSLLTAFSPVFVSSHHFDCTVDTSWTLGTATSLGLPLVDFVWLFCRPCDFLSENRVTEPDRNTVEVWSSYRINFI